MVGMMRRLLIMIIFIAAIIPGSAATAPRPIQDQGSAPFCLFAVSAYLADLDMWTLAAEYYRRNMPTWPGSIIPYNENVLTVASDMGATSFHVFDQWDSQAARITVQSGRPVAASGSGHAIVLIGWNGAGRITYLDSLHAEQARTMRDREFWAWSDGYYWTIAP